MKITTTITMEVETMVLAKKMYGERKLSENIERLIKLDSGCKTAKLLVSEQELKKQQMEYKIKQERVETQLSIINKAKEDEKMKKTEEANKKAEEDAKWEKIV